MQDAEFPSVHSNIRSIVHILLYTITMITNKEDNTMKTLTIDRPRTAPRYPNAADTRYHLRKLLDGLLVAATCAGAFTVLAFLLLL